MRREGEPSQAWDPKKACWEVWVSEMKTGNNSKRPGGDDPVGCWLWGYTHSSAWEASLSREASQTSRTILPWGPRGTRITLK